MKQVLAVVDRVDEPVDCCLRGSGQPDVLVDVPIVRASGLRPSVRVGAVFSPANLAKAAICGWFTQFGTKYSSRLLSYATASVLPNFVDLYPTGALRIVWIGAMSPLAIRG